MEPRELNDAQKKMLIWIEKAGAVSPSRLAAETMMLPDETWGMLYQLSEWGLVVIRDDPDSADGKLVFAAPTISQSKE